jgi:hypothetical protein
VIVAQLKALDVPESTWAPLLANLEAMDEGVLRTRQDANELFAQWRAMNLDEAAREATVRLIDKDFEIASLHLKALKELMLAQVLAEQAEVRAKELKLPPEQVERTIRERRRLDQETARLADELKRDVEAHRKSRGPKASNRGP